MFPDEVAHHGDARLVLNDVDANAPARQPFFLAHERAVLADDHNRNAVQHDGAAAHRARRQRRIDGAGLIDAGGLTSGIFERVHFAVEDCAAALDSSIVAAADDAAVVHQNGSDRNSAVGQALARLVNRGFEKRIHPDSSHDLEDFEFGIAAPELDTAERLHLERVPDLLQRVLRNHDLVRFRDRRFQA